MYPKIYADMAIEKSNTGNNNVGSSIIFVSCLKQEAGAQSNDFNLV